MTLRTRYRVAVRGRPANFEPQVWRWWWPFWAPLVIHPTEGGYYVESYPTSAEAWRQVALHRLPGLVPAVTYEYSPGYDVPRPPGSGKDI